MIQIYSLLNENNGKLYVGQTRTRLSKYLYDQGYKANNRSGRAKPRLYSAIRKHGISSFVVQVLCEAETQADADFSEILFIAASKAQDHYFGYNIADGGLGNNGRIPWNKGVAMSKEFKSKCSSGQKNRFAKHPSSKKGKKLSEEQKIKISATMKLRGIAPSPEARAKALAQRAGM